MKAFDFTPFDFRPYVQEKEKKLDADEAAELAAKVKPHRLVNYELTPAGCPRPANGGGWSPVLGSGPLRPWMVPTQCLLADWVVCALRILSKLPFKVPGAVAGSDLKERGGWGFNGKGGIQGRDGKASSKTAGRCGMTLYDAQGNIMTLDSVEMRGQLPEDADRPAGLITESNFLSQQGDRGLWFNVFYHGAHTSDAKEGKAFGQHWLDEFATFNLSDHNPHTRHLERENLGRSLLNTNSRGRLPSTE